MSAGNIIVAYLGGGVPIPNDAITTLEVEVGDRIAILEHPSTRRVDEDLALLSSVRNLPPAEAARRALDVIVERAAAQAQVACRAVGIIEIAAVDS